MAKIVDVPVSLELWQQILTQGWKMGFDDYGLECVKGLPDGAELISSSYECNPPTVHLIFYHKSFMDTPVGEQIPKLIAEYKRVRIR